MLGIKQEIERQGRYFYLAVVRYFTLNTTSKFLFTVVVIFMQMEVVSGYVKEKAKNVAHSLLFVNSQVEKKKILLGYRSYTVQQNSVLSS